MDFRRYISVALPALCVCLEISAQSIDPTLEVSRTYIAGGMDFSKSTIEMSVPDSLLKFNADFSYSVTDRPYKGSYEFSPHTLDIRPETSAEKRSTFFLRAGAGFPMHPLADIIVSPRFGKAPFTMSLYGTNRSYFGAYREISPDGEWLKWNGSSYTRHSGYESRTRAGIDGRVDWKGGFFTFDAGYIGYADKDTLRTRSYDAGRLMFRVASNSSAEKYFYYDVSLCYKYAEDKIRQSSGNRCVTSHDIALNILLGPRFSRKNAFLMDVNADFSFYGGVMNAYSGEFALTPQYRFSKGRWNLNLGVQFSALLCNDSNRGSCRIPSPGQIVYPAIKIDWAAVTDYLNVYLNVGGGGNSYSYSRLVEENIHYSYLYRNENYRFMNNEWESVRATLGFRGNVASKFSWDVSGGYAFYSGLLCDAVYYSDGKLRPMMNYASSVNYYFASLGMKWLSQDVEARLQMDYRGNDIYRGQNGVFEISPFVAEASVVYNWNHRIYAGIRCNGSLARRGQVAGSLDDVVKIPGYVDLGVSFEYYFTRKMSFWLSGGNLLNMTIQRVPLYTEAGISFTGGITLRL